MLQIVNGRFELWKKWKTGLFTGYTSLRWDPNGRSGASKVKSKPFVDEFSTRRADASSSVMTRYGSISLQSVHNDFAVSRAAVTGR
jgi:hypothetical protein